MCAAQASTGELVELLRHPRSAKRRSAAKKLRRLGDQRAGAELLAALEKEVHDARTWETQYQMVMALGECGYSPALPFLRSLAERSFDATMVYVALGDAIFRLESTSESDASPALALFSTENQMLIDGSLRALAMLRVVPDDNSIREVLAYARGLTSDDAIRGGGWYWIAAAAPGWRTPGVKEFLRECSACGREDIGRAAKSALEGRYLKHSPL